MAAVPAEPQPVIELDRLSKAYNIWASSAARLHGPFFGRIGKLPFLPVAMAERCRRLSENSFRPFYALRDVSLEVKRGETVGVVGRNGSGKSTLLQVVAGTVAPTSGRVAVYGRVAALLELGAGFTPEFTGRENLYLNASILGLSREETEARCPAIIDFADIGEFIDQPVKTYSSGMYVRLAFAVAVNVDADLLIIDEALSVGDEAFQRKCFSRIRAFQEAGGTLLLVSHSSAAVVELCDRALLLDQGELLLAGSPKQVIAQYQKLIYAPAERTAALRAALLGGRSPREATPSSVPSTRHALAEPFLDPYLVPRSTVYYERRGAEIEDPHVETPAGERVNVVPSRRDYVYTYTVRFTQPCFNVRFGMMIKTVSGLELGGAASVPTERALEWVAAETTVSVRFRFRCLLMPGVYFLNAGVLGFIDGAETFIHRVIDAVMLRVQPDPDLLSTGLVDFEATPEVSVVAPAPGSAVGQ